uniref:Uncharacterized protein n=1 Tax=Anguilla anguilla TaxID=7936 RepID=A0A0E9VIP8_ANGAN
MSSRQGSFKNQSQLRSCFSLMATAIKK